MESSETQWDHAFKPEQKEWEKCCFFFVFVVFSEWLDYILFGDRRSEPSVYSPLMST